MILVTIFLLAMTVPSTVGQAMGDRGDNKPFDFNEDKMMKYVPQWKKEIVLWSHEVLAELRRKKDGTWPIRESIQQDFRYHLGVMTGRIMELHKQQEDMFRRMKLRIENKFNWIRHDMASYISDLTHPNYQLYASLTALEYITKRAVDIEALVKVIMEYSSETEMGAVQTYKLPIKSHTWWSATHRHARVTSSLPARRRAGSGLTRAPGVGGEVPRGQPLTTIRAPGADTAVPRGQAWPTLPVPETDGVLSRGQQLPNAEKIEELIHSQLFPNKPRDVSFVEYFSNYTELDENVTAALERLQFGILDYDNLKTALEFADDLRRLQELKAVPKTRRGLLHMNITFPSHNVDYYRKKLYRFMEHQLYSTRYEINKMVNVRRKLHASPVYRIAMRFGNNMELHHKAGQIYTTIARMDTRNPIMWYLILYEKLLNLNFDVSTNVEFIYLLQRSLDQGVLHHTANPPQLKGDDLYSETA